MIELGLQFSECYVGMHRKIIGRFFQVMNTMRPILNRSSNVKTNNKHCVGEFLGEKYKIRVCGERNFSGEKG
jgi:hypothetical protein